MIEGFKLKVKSTELREHCLARSNYHRQRADMKAAELPGLKKALATLKESAPVTVSNMGGKGSASYHMDPDDPAEQLERDIEDHKKHALVFAFFAEHLFDEDYTLTEADLRRLEIVR